MDRTLVFVDLDNIYRGMLENYGVQPTDKNQDGNDLFDIIKKNENDNGNQIEEIFTYADFKYIGDTRYKTSLEERGIQTIDVYSSNSHITRKNASDIQLSIEAVDCACSYDDVKNYVIVSSDSDMIPIVNYLKLKRHKKVALYVLAKQTNIEILKSIPNNGFYKIEDVLNLKQPNSLIEEDIEKYIPIFIKYIFDNEEYNKGRKRIDLTVKYCKWNIMRYHKINGCRLCIDHIEQVLKYAINNNIIKIIINGEYNSENIVLQRSSEIVQEILKNILTK